MFHCDEVLACYLLKQLPEYSDAEIIRSRDPVKLQECDIVVDVGGIFDKSIHRYDHHQREFTETMSSLCPTSNNFNIRYHSSSLFYVMLEKSFFYVYVSTFDNFDRNNSKTNLYSTI